MLFMDAGIGAIVTVSFIALSVQTWLSTTTSPTETHLDCRPCKSMKFAFMKRMIHHT